ncbi:MAG: GlxA family transcriptional regulator [Desulfovibrio sp.]|uniref:GlxA family transcriptional regulator n=1 Tax=Desulfovibrio sp. 7SRBS1 TaxID=3378064 RepID=UPI003B40B0D4
MNHPLHIAILAYDGCVASGVSGFSDVLAMANLLGKNPLFAPRVLAKRGVPVRTFSGPNLHPDAPLGAPAPENFQWDILFVPPAVGVKTPPVELVQWTRKAHAAGTIACAACFGVFVLASAGLLRDRPATTHWGLAESFRCRYPNIPLHTEHILLDHGDIICAGGLTAYFDLALHLITRFASHDLAASCARSLLLDPGRARQTPYENLIATSSHGDAAITEAQQWLAQNHAQPLLINELAQTVHLSERTLLRRFKKATGRTPGGYLQALRIEHAKRLLESTSEPVDTIITRIGYTDAPSFFRRFKKLTGLTPGEYRTRFGPPRSA